MLNRTTLIGNLGKDPELKRLESGKAIAKFSVATSKSYQDKNNEWQNVTTWHNIVVWGDRAEKAERKLKKGSRVYLEGEISNRTYEDRDGNKRTITEIVATYIMPLDKTGSAGQVAATNDAPEPVDEGESDDLPF